VQLYEKYGQLMGNCMQRNFRLIRPKQDVDLMNCVDWICFPRDELLWEVKECVEL
jgi:hypothetical protein